VGVIRTLPDDEIEVLLHTALVGRIACCAHGLAHDHNDDRPFLVPLAYGYDGAAVYAHSGPGRKITLMRAQPLVIFEVDQADAPDQWRSVIAEGAYEEIVDPDERQRALAIIYPPPRPIPPLDPATIVYRLRLTAKSGRYELPE